LNEIEFTPSLSPSAYINLGNVGIANWQAVNELIANSIDSWIGTGPQKELKINIDLDNNPTNLKKGRFQITDNAAGMSVDELKDSWGLFKSSKPKDKKNSDRYLGVYGIGFKSATSKIGKIVTVVTSDNDEEYYKVKVDYEEIINQGSDFKLKINPLPHDSISKKLFNGGPIGTRVIIENFNASFPPERLDEMLPISWKKFLVNPNSFKKKITITRGWTETNKIIQPYDSPAEKDTITPIQEVVEIKKDGKKYKIDVSGFIGFRLNKSQYTLKTQGIHLYRKGQLVEDFTSNFYIKSARRADNNSLVGELDIGGMDASITKSKFDQDSEEYKQLVTHMYKVLSPFVNEAKLMSIAAQKDKKEKDKAVANYRQKQGFKLTDTQKNLIAQGGSVRDISDSKTEKTELIIDAKVPEDKDSFNFRMNGALTFSYNETKYKIEFKKIADEDEEGKLYNTEMPPQGKDLFIIYHLEHPQGKSIEKALKKYEKDDVSALLIRVMVAECIGNFLEKDKQLSTSEIQDCLIKVLNYKLI
jgi:hypothetical protein